MRAAHGNGRIGIEDSLCHNNLSDPQPYGSGTKVAWAPRSLGGRRVPEVIGGERRGRHDKVDAECLRRHRIDRKHVWRF